MVPAELLKMLVCPEDQSPLDLAGSDLIARLNRAIDSGQLTNRAGQQVKQRLTGGLLRADRARLYPIIDDIPMMLIDEAIPMDQPALQA